ncbi:copper resistance CopC family protein [Leucobacter sp. HY1910]
MSQQYSVVPTTPVTALPAAAASHAARPPRRLFALMGGALATAAIALGAMAFGPASPALAHDQLVGSEVVENADGTAEAVRLSFSNSVIEVGTEFVLTGPGGADARGGEPEIDGPDVTQPIKQGLEAGDYAGAWRVVSSDGHPIDGVFTLTVEADGSATLGEGAPETAPAGTTDTASAADTAGDGAAGEAAGVASGAPVGALIGVGAAAVAVVAVVVMLTVRRRERAAAFGGTHTAAGDTAGTDAGTDTNTGTNTNGGAL